MKPTLIIHGASSFTARQLLTYLDEHPQGEEFEVILAGRPGSGPKLDAANKRLKRQREVAFVDLTDDSSVKELVKKGQVVVNLAGPFRWYNAEALIRECASTGKDYIDLTGESSWLATDIIPNYNYLASKTGARIVPSCGFDSVPSDITLYSAISYLQAQHPGLTINKSTSMFKFRGTMSGGTFASMYSVMEIPAEERKEGEWCQTPERHSSYPFKPTYSLSHPLLPFPPKIGSAFLMYPFNRTIVRRSWYLSRLNDNSPQPVTFDPFSDEHEEGAGGRKVQEGKREPRHGDELVYEEGMEVKSVWMAWAISLGMAAFFGLFSISSIFRKLLKYVIPAAGEGASDETLKKGWVKVTNLSTTTDPNIAVLTTYTGEGDPGYWHTCHLMAESALALALPVPEGESLPPLSLRGGCLTPSTAMGQVLLSRLNKSGRISVKSELLVRGAESRKKR